MSDIFISYASEDGDKARALSAALESQGWSVWWDREIPPGESYDIVIERALNNARCVLVLWSNTSVASEWVRSEASEARRRGVLVPIFIEDVESPLAFRLLNGARLRDWQPDVQHNEFDRLLKRISNLLGEPPEHKTAPADAPSPRSSGAIRPKRGPLQWIGVSAALFLVLMLGIYLWSRPTRNALTDTRITAPTGGLPATDPMNARGLDLLSLVAGNPLRIFWFRELGISVAYVTANQAQAGGRVVPSGVVVLAVSAGPAQQAGLRSGDIIISINGASMTSVEDMRSAFRGVGPGKHALRILREGHELSVNLECQSCTAS